MKMPDYKLKVNNESGKDGYVMIFCGKPDSSYSDIQTYAWQSKFIYTGVRAEFKWQVQWAFMWRQLNAVNESQQIVSADLQANNEITLDYDIPHQAFHFCDQKQGDEVGYLYIKETVNVPGNMAQVGVALSGHPVFMVNSEPNLNVKISPKANYFIIFGDSDHSGPIDVDELTEAVEIKFPSNIFSLTAVINSDGCISVESSPLLVIDD